MYTHFYNLREKPFNVTPSPRFLYLGETHKEALSLLTYGVMERKGFVLLTGEVGTGKTTIVQTLLKNLDSSVKYVYLSNPTVSVKDFLSYVAFGLGLRTQFSSKGSFLIQFEEFLQKILQHQQNVLLIIDEAQKLSFELLEEIRLLSNMENPDEKLINIFLVGQPELNRKLGQPICRPLLQRISIRYHIRPLDLEDTREYITTRLKVAGAANGTKIFSKNVIEAIHQYSEGYPRLINILADNVLLLGYSKGEKKITPAMVNQSYQDLKLNGSVSKSPGQYEIRNGEQVHTGSYWKWAVLLFFAAIFTAAVMSQEGQNLVRRMTRLIPIGFQAPKDSSNPSKEQPLTKEKTKREIEAISGETPHKESTADVQTEKKQAAVVDIIPHGGPKEMKSTLRVDDKETWKTFIVKEGDTLLRLVTTVYGWADANNLKLVRKYNPQIEDIDRIAVGQKIIFPPLPALNPGPTFTVHIGSFRSLEGTRDLFQKSMREGYEVYILPSYDLRNGKVFRVTLGNFNSRQEAEDFAATVLKGGLSDYARVIHLDTR